MSLRRSLRRSLRAALHINLLLAGAAASLVAATALLARSDVPLEGAIAAFASAFAVYNLDRVADTTVGDGSTSPRRAALVQRFRGPLWGAVAIAAGLTVVVAARSGWVASLWILAFPLAGVLYVTPLIGGRRLKDIPYIKSFYVPACWCTFIGLAASMSAQRFDGTIVAFAVFFYLRMFVSAGLGDIRDAHLDAATGVRTFAVALGRARASRVIAAAHAASIGGVALAAVVGVLPLGAIWLVVPATFGYACYRRFIADSERSELLLEIYDLEMVAYAPVLWLAL